MQRGYHDLQCNGGIFTLGFHVVCVYTAGSNSRGRWSAIRQLLHSTKPVNVIPGGQGRCDAFASYFVNKTISIKAAIATKLAGNAFDALNADGAFNGVPLDDLQPPTTEEVRKLIGAMPAKSSPTDSIPTSILKSCPDIFSRLIARLATLSFREGRFPDSYKTASVTPLLKKKDSDQDNMANFRPISNLHTISKLLEKLVLSRNYAARREFDQFQPLPVGIQTGLLDRIRHSQTAQ